MKRVVIGGSDKVSLSGLQTLYNSGEVWVLTKREVEFAKQNRISRQIQTKNTDIRHAKLNMSRTWYWRPIVKPPAGMRVEDRMLDVFRTRAQRTSHFGNENDEFPMILTKADIPWLNGLTDAGITEAGEFITALNHHAEVEVYFEY